ncbi:mannitol-1-phosphate 5-dehydrogenase [Paenibacillus daejeonensis]|uniref:mannitol-1-phosphate 5-dehydrogenase n=1 Tax=Paenibacillus daejeonensis TaxID=135193 RepID=UPI00036E94AD|nr:mannitol-1-phosphate 5-dehydrogenase [Paenibacillus daejeonensis]
MKAVHFGAGNIGRGFIGLILGAANYEVCFVDVNRELVEHLQARGSYKVALASDEGETVVVGGVSAIDGADLEAVSAAVSEADLVTTAVGPAILRHIAPGIARGISRRMAAGTEKLQVIACENAIGASEQLKSHVYPLLSEEEQTKADDQIAFPNAAVDRIVPIQSHADPLFVRVEPFYEWVVERSPLGVSEIPGVHYVDELTPYIERKLFTVNTGHCTAAYHGYRLGAKTIQEALELPEVLAEVEGTLAETGELLCKKHGFDRSAHQDYIHTIIGRFRNPHLSDDVARVGRSPLRKLSPEDRLVRPARQADELELPTGHLTTAMGAAMVFKADGDEDAEALQEMIREQGAAKALTHVTGLAEESPLHAAALAAYNRFNQA